MREFATQAKVETDQRVAGEQQRTQQAVAEAIYTAEKAKNSATSVLRASGVTSIGKTPTPLPLAPITPKSKPSPTSPKSLLK